MLHNRQEAEDMTQEVFLEVYRSIDKFQNKCKLSTWIYRIAINKSLNQVKRNKIRRFFSMDNDSVLKVDSFEQSDWGLKEKQYNNYLHQAIEKLPKKQKQAFILFSYDELPQKEIAEIMNCSLSSVEVLVFRARKTIKSYMETIDKEIFK
jgi:RNA polymerase sigma-70 factor (ECF subfamily)